MKNTLTVKTLPNTCVQTDFVTADGVSIMEIHTAGVHDSRVLTKILDRKYYQHIKGSWVISFPDDGWTGTATTFEKVVDAAHMHIFNRDNNFVSYDGYN